MNILSSLTLLLLLLPFAADAAQVGQPAPAFSLKDMKGNLVTLESFKGMVVFLDFWAPWCQSCKEELPDLDALYKKYASRGFTVLSITVEKSGDMANKYLQNKPVSFPVLVDANGEVAETYSFSGLPASFLIGKDGIIRHKHMGYGKELLNVYEQEITGLLNK
jgi:peroxiredoxin